MRETYWRASFTDGGEIHRVPEIRYLIEWIAVCGVLYARLLVLRFLDSTQLNWYYPPQSIH